jgi:KipI family sensor histidine kinase inhibitor
MPEKLPINLIQISPSRFELQWPPLIDESVLNAKLQVKAYLENSYGDIISELRVAYASISVDLHPGVVITDWGELLEELNALHINESVIQKHTWTIPVCYGGTYGKDLAEMARQVQLEETQLIQLHQSGDYLLHFYGFLPGFMYLGGLAKELHFPRKAVPDKVIPAGTVAIGGQQTGIYPITSPGGWHAIGRSPLVFTDFSTISNRPQIGDRIRFSSIDSSAFEAISAAIKNGSYHWHHD